MTDYCNFPVAKLNSTGMQICKQKCTYVGNYNTTSSGNKLIQEAPYTMCNMIYNGSADVMFNGVSYSNTIDTNIIEVSLSKPLHTYDSSLNPVAELIIRHQTNASGYNDLWICIPVVNITDPFYNFSSNLGSSSIKLVETMLTSLPGIPYIKYDGKEGTLLRMGKNAPTELSNPDNISKHYHDDKPHSHYHIVNQHGITGDTNAIANEASIEKSLTEGGDEISNQVEIYLDYKLNDVIPTAPYYYYKGLYSIDCTVSAEYASSGTKTINVIVFDIADAIPITDLLSKAVANESITTSDTASPILLDNCYVAQLDTTQNVSYHKGNFTQNVGGEDDIYINCQPTDACGNTVLIDKETNNAIDAGDNTIMKFFGDITDGPIVPILVGLIAIVIVFNLGRTFLKLIFGKDKLPDPSTMFDNDGHTDVTK